jgi:hypothetical protein
MTQQLGERFQPARRSPETNNGKSNLRDAPPLAEAVARDFDFGEFLAAELMASMYQAYE